MIILIAAVAENGAIGFKNRLPWHIPEDLERFKKLTTDKVVLMGKNTFESILDQLGKPLPNRVNVVLAREEENYNPLVEGVEVFNSISNALDFHKDEDIYVIGGAQVYKQTIGRADKLYITHVEKKVQGDTFFPSISDDEWELTEEKKRDGYRFAVYKKKK